MMDAESLLEDNRIEQRDNAKAALRAASKAVAKARDAVVLAAKAWGGDERELPALSAAVFSLRHAERVEVEARARLVALR